jgi:3-oxoacyl-[acyl-carrier protein] reductase
MLLKNKVAIITGSGAGMGKSIATLFANEGAAVVIADINKAAAQDTARSIEAKGGLALAVKVDVGNKESVQYMVDQTINKFGRVDIVLNNAGLPQAFTPIEELEEEKWDQIFNVNTKSVFLSSKFVVPIMKKQGSGVIVNTASIAAERARPGLNAYCASKGAVTILTKALAIELAEFGIRVNAINPGPANTTMLGKFVNGSDEEIDQQKKSVFINSVPLGRLIEPDDIAQAALYLCSDMSKSVTGTVLNVDGGRGI